MHQVMLPFQIVLVVLMVIFVWLMELLRMKDVLKSVVMEYGALFVMMVGIQLMLM